MGCCGEYNMYQCCFDVMFVFQCMFVGLFYLSVIWIYFYSGDDGVYMISGGFVDIKWVDVMDLIGVCNCYFFNCVWGNQDGLEMCVEIWFLIGVLL